MGIMFGPGGGFGPFGPNGPVGGGVGLPLAGRLEGGVFDPIGGTGVGGGFSSRSEGLAEATITITSPKGPLVDETFRVGGTAMVKMEWTEFIKAGGEGHSSSGHWFVTDGFTVTVTVGETDHEAQVTPMGDTLHWFVDVATADTISEKFGDVDAVNTGPAKVADVPPADTGSERVGPVDAVNTGPAKVFDVPPADTGPVTITAALDGIVWEGGGTSFGFGGAPGDSHVDSRKVHRTDSVDVTIDPGDVTVSASIQTVMIGSPYEASIEGTAESAFAIESIEVDPAGWLESVENRSGDWSNWRAMIELPNRDQEHNVTITARNDNGNTGSTTVTVPKGNPVVNITKPIQDVETYLWQDGGITVTIEGTAGAEHSTLQAVRWRLTNIAESKEGVATETEADWGKWSIDLDIDRSGLHILEMWAVDTAETESRVTDSSSRELRVQVPGVAEMQQWAGIQATPLIAIPVQVVPFGGSHGRI